MKLKITLSAFALTMILTGSLQAEYIFLKDGSIIQGTITTDSATSLTLRLKGKGFQRIPRSNIMRILYTELYMGKVYVQKTDGKGIVAYMVDEDRETYTFRIELYKPDEFILKRDQVLFMARGNPTGLTAEAGTDRAELKWFAPYMPVKSYNIYVKGPREKEYRLEGKVRGLSYSLKNLTSNTKYQVHVTAIDSSGDETLPSNEITLVTLNIPPDKPVITSVAKQEKGDYKITWNEATDPDGKVTGYRVYRQYKGKTELFTDLKKTEFILKKETSFDAIYVKSLDDRGTESASSRVYFGYTPETGISAAPAFLYPMGRLKDLASYGYGITAKYEMSNYFLSQLELNAELSFFYLPGKDNYIEPESKGDSIFLAPLMISAGYAFYPGEYFAIIPYISAGVMLMHYSYSYFDISTSGKKNVAKFQADPALGAGMAFRYSFPRGIYITLNIDYRIFFEKSNNFSYMSTSIGAGKRF